MKLPMTPRGHRQLRRELKRLKSQRPELAKAIEIARGHGDLSENADYDAAKEKSGMVEAKIRDIESRLSAAEVIDPLRLQVTNRVVFGVSVHVEDVESGEKRTLSIVGSEESDVKKGMISFDSPIARSLLGKEAGDTTRVVLPNGNRELEIVEIFVDYVDEGEDAEADAE